MYQHILIPTDGSPLSEAASRSGIALAKSLNARVSALYVSPRYDDRPPSEGSAMMWESRKHFEDAARNRADQVLGVVKKMAGDQGVSCDADWVYNDYPYEAIIEAAKSRNCDLIFMASHGRSGVKAILLGSETNKVLTHCTIPVLVCR